MDFELFLDPSVIAALKAQVKVTRHTQVKRKKAKTHDQISILVMASKTWSQAFFQVYDQYQTAYKNLSIQYKT